MNLSPKWVTLFEEHGLVACHWSALGDPRASDSTVMKWALANGYIVFTHDLDFGSALAVTQASGPSVIQVRAQDTSPEHLGALVIQVLDQYASFLDEGALIVVDEERLRARILPLG
ncbi:MAG: DUF5615 family PIN-like protein [bacterium]